MSRLFRPSELLGNSNTVNSCYLQKCCRTGHSGCFGSDKKLPFCLHFSYSILQKNKFANWRITISSEKKVPRSVHMTSRDLLTWD